jgi:hypothetical protein
MAGNPQIAQGTLNRLLGSVVFLEHPELNITAPFLSQEAISITFSNDAGLLLPTMTGGVNSPEPYQMVDIAIHLIRAQSFSDLYKQQIEDDTNVGDFTVIPDSVTLSEYVIVNGIIKGQREVSFDGKQPGLLITLSGIYYVNNSLWVS